MLLFYGYKKCSTSNKAEKWLNDHKISYRFIDLKTEKPEKELYESYIRRSALPLKRFINTSGQLYREMSLKTKLPFMSEDEIIELLASDGMLMKRPMIVDDDFVLTGFKEEEWKEALKVL